MKCLAIVSGGMDSVTMLYQYRKDITHVLNFMYGSKHNEQETQWAEYHADKLGKQFERIDLSFIGKLFKSDLLLTGGAIPDGHYADESMRSTVVPFRNGIMLSIAAGYAESHGCTDVLIANHYGDHAIYPDCRTDFITPMKDAIRLGTYKNIRLLSPYASHTKREIAKVGKRLQQFPYTQTYSCYKGGDVHCGTCGTCTERKEALEGSDKTEYLA
jgi:7-cyano-7-deazaguanine synthase